MSNETIPAVLPADTIGKPLSQMGEFTPGPWHVEAYSLHGINFGIFARDIEIAKFASKANARLIAAAPDMLAALIASEAEYGNLEDDAPVDSGCPDCTLNTVPATLDTGLCAHHLRVDAIAKATGRT